jgi:hypothetical protein
MFLHASSLYVSPCIVAICFSVHRRYMFLRASSLYVSPCIVVICFPVHRRYMFPRASSLYVSPCIVIICFPVHRRYMFPRASSLYAEKKKPTRCHSMIYCSCELLYMFRALTCPSSRAPKLYLDYDMPPIHPCVFFLGFGD